jgi:hypothetical protein
MKEEKTALGFWAVVIIALMALGLVDNIRNRKTSATNSKSNRNKTRVSEQAPPPSSPQLPRPSSPTELPIMATASAKTTLGNIFDMVGTTAFEAGAYRLNLLKEMALDQGRREEEVQKFCREAEISTNVNQSIAPQAESIEKTAVPPMARNYSYGERYENSPEQIKNREARERARAEQTKKLGESTIGPSIKSGHFPTISEMWRISVMATAEELGVNYLIHFTRAENLPSIIQNGLCSVATLNARGLSSHTNDHLRLDGHRDAVCLSIAHPNDKMFAKYRWENPEQDWVVLVLDRSIMWTMKAAFCRHNAADKRMSRQPIADLMSASAFNSMFLQSDDQPPREENGLMQFDPTDVQAEVLVFDVLQPRLIKGAIFSNTGSSVRYKDCLEERSVDIHAERQGFFGARSYARKTGWAY